MNFLNLFKFKRQENRNLMPPTDNTLLTALLNPTAITARKAMNIPAVAECVNLISETVSMIPIKLYREEITKTDQFDETNKAKEQFSQAETPSLWKNEKRETKDRFSQTEFSWQISTRRRKTVEIDDIRTELLNFDTKDTLSGVEFKRAMVRDYLLHGAAYAYIKKVKNQVKSLHYVPFEEISIIQNSDIIFKDFNIAVQGKIFKPFEFLKILKSTKDGATGLGLIEENSELLNVAYTMLQYERNLVATGGNKKGFINSNSRLSQESINTLRLAWKNLYSNNEENVIILNDGLTFKEASNTSVEMQLNENKKSMNSDIRSIFGVPPDLKYEKYETFIKIAITPILSEIECALNRDLLLEKEKEISDSRSESKNSQSNSRNEFRNSQSNSRNESKNSKSRNYYFAFDMKEITKGDIKSRFEAYKLALDANIMQIDEVRYLEDLEPLNVNFIKLGLKDVMYDPATKTFFTPNTGQSINIGEEMSKRRIAEEDLKKWN